MAGDLDALAVRLVDRGFQLGAPDVGVRLQPRRALRRPVRHEAHRLLRRLQQRHAGRALTARDVRRGDVDARAGGAASLDLGLEVQLGVGCAASRRPHGGDAGPQVEPRRTVGELRAAAAGGRVVQVVVQADESRNHRVPGQVDDVRALGRPRRARVAHRRDAAVLDHHRLIFARGRARAVDQPHVRQRDHRRVDRDVVADARRNGFGTLRLRRARTAQRRQCQDEPGAHQPARPRVSGSDCAHEASIEIETNVSVP